MNNFEIPYNYFYDFIIEVFRDDQKLGMTDISYNSFDIKGKNGKYRVYLSIKNNILNVLLCKINETISSDNSSKFYVEMETTSSQNFELIQYTHQYCCFTKLKYDVYTFIYYEVEEKEID